MSLRRCRSLGVVRWGPRQMGLFSGLQLRMGGVGLGLVMCRSLGAVRWEPKQIDLLPGFGLENRVSEGYI